MGEASEEPATGAADGTTRVDHDDPDTLVPDVLPSAAEPVPLEGFIDQNDRYEARELLARGGMGEVHLAWDTRLRREVALKTLRTDFTHEGFAQRFALEGRVAGQLEHPNIVPVHDCGIAKDGRPFYVMRWIRGRSLAQLIGEGQLPSQVERIDVFRKVCDAIAFAHSRGVLHRDLKPGNVMVGEFGEVIVLDWGIARLSGSSDSDAGDNPLISSTALPQTRAGEVLGTPVFMAPELLKGLRDQVDERADVYALGVMLYQLLTDALPFSGPDALKDAKAGRYLAPRRRRPDRIDREIDAIVRCAMGDAAQRYRSADALRRDVLAYLEGREVTAFPRSRVGRVGKWARRNRRIVAPVLATAVLAIVALLVIAALYAGRLASSRDQALAAERDAALQLARAETAFARTWAETGRFEQAREALQQARAIVEARDESTIVVDLTETFLVHEWTPPLLAWRAHDKAREGYVGWVSATGDTYIFVDGSSLATVMAIPQGELLASWRPDPSQRVAQYGFVDDRAVAVIQSPERIDVHDIVANRSLLGIEGAALQSLWLGSNWLLVAEGRERRWVALPSGEPSTYRLPAEARFLSLSADGALATGHISPDLRRPDEVLLWERATGAVRGRFPGAVSALVSPSGRWLVAHGPERTELHEIGPHGCELRWSGPPTGEVAFSLDSQRVYLASGDRVLTQWAVPDMRKLDEQPFVGHITGVTREGDVITGDSRGWALRTGSGGAGAFDNGAQPVMAAPTPDGALVAIASWDGVVRVWEPWTGTLVRTFTGSPRGTRSVAFSPNASRIAAADRDGRVRVWDFADGTTVAEVTAIDELAMGVCFLDEDHVIVGWEHAEISAWSLVTGERTASYLDRPSTTWDLQLSPDAALLVATGRGNGDPLAVAWDVAGGGPRWVSPIVGPAYRARFDPDGARLVVGTHIGQPTWFDRATWTATLAEIDEPDPVMSATFVDRELVAGGSSSGALDFWDAGTGAFLAGFPLHGDSIADVIVLPRTRALVTLSEDGGVRLFDLDRPRIVAESTPMQTDDGFVVGDAPERALELARLAALRGDWSRAVGHQRAALAGGATPSPLERARASWAAGAHDDARAALADAEESGEILAGTRRAWSNAP